MRTPGSPRAGAEGLLHHPAAPVKWAAQGHESSGPTPPAAAFATSGQHVPGLPRGVPSAARSAWHRGSRPDSGQCTRAFPGQGVESKPRGLGATPFPGGPGGPSLVTVLSAYVQRQEQRQVPVQGLRQLSRGRSPQPVMPGLGPHAAPLPEAGGHRQAGGEPQVPGAGPMALWGGLV